MPHAASVLAPILLALACAPLAAQVPAGIADCGCTVDQVLANRVPPCARVVGEVVEVTDAEELRAAIREANDRGGDMTILLADGTYPVVSPSSYPYLTASNLVIRGRSGDREAVVVTGSGMRSVAPGTEMGFFAVGDDITIADLTIRDIGNHAIAASGERLTVRNVRFQDTYEQMLKGVSAAGGADDARVHCNLFEYTAGIGPQYYIGGIDAHEADRWVVSDNVFRDIASPNRSAAEHAVHLWRGSRDNLVERNLVVDCDRGIGFGLGDVSDPALHCSGVIRNNAIANVGSDPFHDVGIGLESAPGTVVAHNTVHVAYRNAIEYRFAATAGATVVNNLTNRAVASRNGGQAAVAGNVSDAAADWYVDAPAGDLHLAAARPGVTDAAVATTATTVAVDHDRNPRPQGGAADVGAHEWMGATSAVGAVRGQPDFAAYPSPFTDALTVALPEGTVVEVVSVAGRAVATRTVRGGRLELGRLPAGPYIVAAGAAWAWVVKR